MEAIRDEAEAAENVSCSSHVSFSILYLLLFHSCLLNLCLIEASSHGRFQFIVRTAGGHAAKPYAE